MSDSVQRVAIITSDAHAGANLLAYRPYLESRWYDEFERWATDFVNPFESEHLLTNDPSCNWDSARRTRLLESQAWSPRSSFPTRFRRSTHTLSSSSHRLRDPVRSTSAAGRE